MSLSEELESEALIELCTVGVLLSVVEHGGVIAGDAEVRGLSQLHAGERVHKEEGGELEAVLVGAEHVLVVEEVGTEEEEETFEVHDLGVLSTMDETRA